jgi:hypothetical protein
MGLGGHILGVTFDRILGWNAGRRVRVRHKQAAGFTVIVPMTTGAVVRGSDEVRFVWRPG